MSDPTNAENPIAETANEQPAVPVVPYKAIIDRFGILMRYERTNDEGIPVPEDCDLVPGKYRWDGERFIPIMQAFGKQTIDNPSTVAAIAEGFIAIRDRKPLPISTLEWLAAYERSFDAAN